MHNSPPPQPPTLPTDFHVVDNVKKQVPLFIYLQPNLQNLTYELFTYSCTAAQIVSLCTGFQSGIFPSYLFT